MSRAAAQKQADAAQLRAADPTQSVWVAASAGSGKTKVLSDRVLSLLLAGVEPSRILCLTFTRAAAAEMANRIAERLRKWTASGDADLARDVRQITGAPPDDARRRLARQLFARVLDTPGGMKIETLHAFCQSLLRRFPLEAELAPHFELLDERSASDLMRDAREEVLAAAKQDGGGSGLAVALAGVTAHAGEEVFAELMQTLTAERHRLARLFAVTGGLTGAVALLRRRLGVAAGETERTIRAAGCDDAALDLLGLRLAADALATGTKTDKARGLVLSRWLAEPGNRAALYKDYRSIYLTADGDIRQKLAGKEAQQVGGVIDILESEAERLLALEERIRAAIVFEATASLIGLGAAMLDAYRRHKETRALLDYDDLVNHAVALLEREGIAPWVLFKLDGGIDHILIDEAQDTNPEQWEVVRILAGEFFSGEGARPGPRTVFAVGDAKQSIFSFQRADPEGFTGMRAHFSQALRAMGAQLQEVPLTVSFRSTPAVLAAVDAIFARDDARNGVALDGAAIAHQAIRSGQAGLVELWPPVTPHEAETPEPWAPPTTRVGTASPERRLARLIATRIALMTAGAEMLESRGRPIRPGDIMVLVRRRNNFLEELVRELKQRGVPVAGVDRMVLTDQLAVMDLVALGRFLLLPEDDLTLATVLKSPFIGLDEAALFDLAHDRGTATLWSELRRRRGERKDFARAEALLAELLGRADFVPPHELYADLLGRLGGRRALLGRLGPEAGDPIDEFMNLALAYERAHVPSLQGFLHWLAAGRAEIKRDLDQGGHDQVRIMTVHGAKGLQAPIVFLPDTLGVPQPKGGLLWRRLDEVELPIWSPKSAFDEAEATAARAERRFAEMREYRRLLYVALTRAEDRLYACGWQGGKAPTAGNWYELVRNGLGDVGEAFAFDCTAEIGPEDGWAGPGLRLANPQTEPAETPRERAGFAAVAPAPLADWAAAPPPAEPTPPRPLAPSRPAGDEPPVRSPLGEDDGTRFRRGLLIHKLLEILPEAPAARRPELARRFLARPIHELDPDRQDEIAREVLRLFEDPALAALFGPGSFAELPVAGEIIGADGSARVIHGQIDRLVIMEQSILIVDYKTNRPPPQAESEVAPLYLRQMATYRAAVRRIYPDKRIDCALLWTDGPRFMPLGQATLDSHAP
jgi:ATP-dependent helicase/nuclease subunit A